MIDDMELGDEAPTALYRFYAADGTLLYVGITNSMKARLAQHAADKSWWPEVARKTVAWHTTRAAALAAESAAIRGEHPLHNIAGVAKPPSPSRSLHAVRDWDDDDRYDDTPPSEWPDTHWCRVWWGAERGSNASQHEFLDIFGCPARGAMEAFGMWHGERRLRRQDQGGWPLVWHQMHHAHPADVNVHPGFPYRYSIHADVTCIDPWDKFTPEAERAQESFLHALLNTGYCRSVHPGRAAAAFGFGQQHQVEMQIAGAILGDLMWGGTDVAIRSTEALLGEPRRASAG